MKEHPILFSAPMVRALLDDRKHVTRRLSKQWLKVKAGDRLWVRETFCLENCLEVGYYPPPFNDGRPINHHDDDENGVWWEQPHYRATDPTPELDIGRDEPGVKWRPSIHMPRWASRILLECEEDARMERLQEITEEEAVAEGFKATPAEQWYEGLKPMLDGTYVRQQSRGLPPETWRNVQPCCREWDADGNPIPDGYDPLAKTARVEFQRLWSILHRKPGERFEDNPEVVRVGRFRRIV